MIAKLITFLSLIAILSSCTTQRATKESIIIEQVETALPISLLGDTINNIIIRCRIPLGFKISSSSSKSEFLQLIDYYYNKCHGKSYLGKYADGWKGSFKISQYINDDLKVSTSQRLIEKKINSKLSQKIVIEPSYDFDTCRSTQVMLKPYIEKMKALHTNKLSIDDIKEFEIKYPELMEILLKGDSIKFTFFDEISKSHEENKCTIITRAIEY